ncbi:MAG TPA: permease-like cell division protein FtsX [Candidatus Saccharimonadales bacterium]|nr:permease-like cell division protein FtsX [Candidatus Saccharimonadales bacterium]
MRLKPKAQPPVENKMNRDHKFITLERIFKNGFVNFGRNIWLAIAAMAMMAVTLTILLFAIVANATFSHTISDITSHIDVSVYLKDEVTDEQRSSLIVELKQIDNVQAVGYTSKDQALKNYRAQNIDNPELLAAISETDNPLPASLVISPKDPNKLDTIKDYLDKPEIEALQSDPTSYSGDRKAAIDKIAKATQFFRQAGIIGIIIFIIISMLIIFNTIRMTIFNRRDELVIMRLLGATPGYIRGPFIVETMLYGVVAAAVSLIVCGGLFAVASSTLQASSLGLLDIKYSSDYFSNNLWLILTAQILAGIIIGAASAAIATRRYLKLK